MCVCVCVCVFVVRLRLCDTRCARLRERPSWGAGSEELGGATGYFYFDVFPTVHHSIGYFLEPTLMQTSI